MTTAPHLFFLLYGKLFLRNKQFCPKRAVVARKFTIKINETVANNSTFGNQRIVKISLEKFDDPLISKRAVIGDCMIDFYRKFPGDDRTLGAELLIPKEKLTVQQEKEMRSSRHFDEPFDAPKYFTRELSREVAKFGSDTNNKSLFSTLYGPDGDKMIRDFIASPEMRKTLSEIPTHCLIQDTYRPKPQKTKQAQR